MNKFAIAIAALSLSAGAAFAENPHFGRADLDQSGLNSGQVVIDQSTTASVDAGAAQDVVANYDADRSRYGDGAPYAGR